MRRDLLIVKLSIILERDRKTQDTSDDPPTRGESLGISAARKPSRNVSSLMRRLICLFVLFTAMSYQRAEASFQIGVFANNGTPSYQWVNNGNVSATLSGNSPGFFSYTNLSGLQLMLPAELQGPQAAHMLITESTTAPASLFNNQIVQPLSGTITVAVTRDAAVPGFGAGTNLLTATITLGSEFLTGTGSSAAIIASQPRDNVTFTSDFINTSLLNTSAFSISLVGITPELSLNTSGGNSLVNNFNATGSAIFSANAVPEPGSIALLLVGGVVLAGTWRRNGVAKA